MPRTTIVDIPPTQQARMLAEMRRARYGYLLAPHLLLLCAAGRFPTEIAGVFFCSRSGVYHVVKADRAGRLEVVREREEAASGPVRVKRLGLALKRAVVAILKVALEWQARTGRACVEILVLRSRARFPDLRP